MHATSQLEARDPPPPYIPTLDEAEATNLNCRKAATASTGTTESITRVIRQAAVKATTVEAMSVAMFCSSGRATVPHDLQQAHREPFKEPTNEGCRKL